jgi:Tol biopolymer transport system component
MYIFYLQRGVYIEQSSSILMIERAHIWKKKILFLSIFPLVAVITLEGGYIKAFQALLSESVPHEERFGIYLLDLATEDVTLIYTSPRKISGLSLTSRGDTLAFSQESDGSGTAYEEICIIEVDGSNYRRLTSNTVMDTYPCWSPDGSAIAFLSWRDKTMDIYIMDFDGSDARQLYDSGGHDGDIHWLYNTIAFTRNSQIWVMNSDGTDPRQITDPPRAGEWGKAVLPFGDYDPRIHPDGTKILFERMVDDKTRHGNYNIYAIDIDGSSESALTDTGYTQGLAHWSHDGTKIVYLVTAVGENGKYDIYTMNADGTESQDINPDYFPAAFLCHSPIFSSDDSKIFFVGEWWEQESTTFPAFLVIFGLLLALVAFKRIQHQNSNR